MALYHLGLRLDYGIWPHFNGSLGPTLMVRLVLKVQPGYGGGGADGGGPCMGAVGGGRSGGGGACPQGAQKRFIQGS